MTIQNHNFDSVHFVAALQFLIERGRGTRSTRKQIGAWIEMLEEDDQAAWQLDTLKGLFDALAVVAFANAGFRKLPAAERQAGMLSFEIEDQGGYFVALKTIGTILAVAPLCDDCLSELVAHVEDSLLKLLEQLDRLLARR